MSSQADLLFGKLAVMNKFVTQPMVDECVALQEQYAGEGTQASLGDIMVKQGYLKPNQLTGVLRAQQYMSLRSEDMRFGQIAVANKFSTQETINAALEQQAADFKAGRKVVRVGKIVLDSGLMTPQQVNACLKAQDRIKVQAAQPAPSASAAAAAGEPPPPPPAPSSPQARTQTRFGAAPSSTETQQIPAVSRGPQEAPAAPVPPAVARPAVPASPAVARPAVPASPAVARPAVPASPAVARPAVPASPAVARPAVPASPAVARPAVPAPPAVARPTAPASPAAGTARPTPTAAPAPDTGTKKKTSFMPAPQPPAAKTPEPGPRKKTVFQPAPQAEDVPTAPTVEPVMPDAPPVATPKRKTIFMPVPTASVESIPEAPVAPTTTNRPTRFLESPVAPAGPGARRPTEYRPVGGSTGTEVPTAPTAATPGAPTKSLRPTGLGLKPPVRPTGSMPAPGAAPTGPSSGIPRRPTVGMSAPKGPGASSVKPAAKAPEPAGDTQVFALGAAKVSLRSASVNHKSGQIWGVHVVTLHGNLDGKTFPHIEEFLKNLMDQGHFRFVLNCKGLDYLSSAGVGVLISVATRSREVQGDILLSEVPKKVLGIINVLGLGAYLTAFANDDAALAALAQV